LELDNERGYSLSEYSPKDDFFLAQKVVPFLPKNEKFFAWEIFDFQLKTPHRLGW
jgi:hypothetical protein